MSPTRRRVRAVVLAAVAAAALLCCGPAGAAGPAPRSAPPVAHAAPPTTASLLLARAHPGRAAGIVPHWWGWEIRLRNRKTNRIISVLNAGAGIATLASVLAAAGVISSPGAVPSGILAAVIALGGRALDLCNWNGRGIRILVARPLVGATCVPR